MMNSTLNSTVVGYTSYSLTDYATYSQSLSNLTFEFPISSLTEVVDANDINFSASVSRTNTGVSGGSVSFGSYDTDSGEFTEYFSNLVLSFNASDTTGSASITQAYPYITIPSTPVTSISGNKLILSGVYITPNAYISLYGPTSKTYSCYYAKINSSVTVTSTITASVTMTCSNIKGNA